MAHGQSRRPLDGRPRGDSQAAGDGTRRGGDRSKYKSKPKRRRTVDGTPFFKPFRGGSGPSGRVQSPAVRSRTRTLANESEMYDGPPLDGEIRAYRKPESRQPVAGRSRPKPPRASSRRQDSRRQDSRTQDSRTQDSRTEDSRAQRSRAQNPRAQRSKAQDSREPHFQVQSSRARYEETRRQSLRAYGAAPTPHGRTARTAASYSSGGAAALTVGRAMAEVARPAATAARPMLNLVAGGLEKLPTGTVAQPAARGRVLIVIVGLLAAGLIYINVGKLEAGDGYGRYAQRSQELQRENTILRARIAGLDSAERIVKFAKKKLNMVMPQPEQFKYLRARNGDPLRAMRNYTAPTTAPVPAPPTQTPGTIPGTQSPTGGAAPAQPQHVPNATPGAGGQAPGTAPTGTAPTGTTPTGAGPERSPAGSPGANAPGAANGNTGASAPGGH